MYNSSNIFRFPQSYPLYTLKYICLIFSISVVHNNQSVEVSLFLICSAIFKYLNIFELDKKILLGTSDDVTRSYKSISKLIIFWKLICRAGEVITRPYKCIWKGGARYPLLKIFFIVVMVFYFHALSQEVLQFSSSPS